MQQLPTVATLARAVTRTTHRPTQEAKRRPTLDSGLDVEIGTPEWATLLEAPETTRFVYEQDGVRFTARRERQGRYWYAYRRCGGRLRKLYLGKTAELTRARLGVAVREFAAIDSHRLIGRSEPLPAELTSFVGRARELRELKQHFR